MAPQQKANLNTNMLQVKSATSATDNNSNEMRSERLPEGEGGTS